MRILEDFELAAFERDAVEQDGGEHHPADGEQPERRAVGRWPQSRAGGHPVDPGGHQRWRRPGRPARRSRRACGTLPSAAAERRWGRPPGAPKAANYRRRGCSSAATLPWTRRSLPLQRIRATALDDFAGAGFGQRSLQKFEVPRHFEARQAAIQEDAEFVLESRLRPGFSATKAAGTSPHCVIGRGHHGAFRAPRGARRWRAPPRWRRCFRRR